MCFALACETGFLDNASALWLSVNRSVGLLLSVGVGAVSEGMTVMESFKTGELVTSDCDAACSLSELLNSREELTVCLALMNSVSWIVRSRVIRIDLVSGWYTR